MIGSFPRYSNSAKLGERGVGIVSRVVADSFGWLFKRNHQEHDFGIDGQIELVDDDGGVTGKIIGVQIKCGKSFFTEENRWGYVYRGEKKHFNYLANYPIPVIVVICDPDSEECHWVLFEPEKAELTQDGWKLTVPFKNSLLSSKAYLASLVGPIRDARTELNQFWRFNDILQSSDII